MLCYLTRAVVPGFEVFAFGLVDFAQLIAIGTEDVRRGEDMRDVVMETEVVVDDGMGDVIVPATITFQLTRSSRYSSSSSSSSAESKEFTHFNKCFNALALFSGRSSTSCTAAFGILIAVPPPPTDGKLLKICGNLNWNMVCPFNNDNNDLGCVGGQSMYKE